MSLLIHQYFVWILNPNYWKIIGYLKKKYYLCSLCLIFLPSLFGHELPAVTSVSYLPSISLDFEREINFLVILWKGFLNVVGEANSLDCLQSIRYSKSNLLSYSYKIQIINHFGSYSSPSWKSNRCLFYF